MKTDFEKMLNRSQTNERRWNPQYIEATFKINYNKNTIDSSIADLDFKTPTPIVEALQNRINHGTFSYTYIREDVLQAISSWYKNYHQLQVATKNIKLVHGTVNAMHQIVNAFTKIGEGVLIQTPIYEPFGRCIYNNDRVVVENKLIYENQTYKMDFQDFEAKIIADKIKLFFWCNPHNPGGVVWSKSDAKKLIEICEKHQVLLVSDEVHSDLILENQKFYSLLDFKVKNNYFIICASPNKAFNLGGLKGSYLIIENEEIRKKIDKIYEANSITSPNVFYPEAIKAAYTSKIVLNWLTELKAYIWANYQLLVKEFQTLKNVEIMKLQASYLVWIKFDDKIYDVKTIKKQMQDNDIIVNWDTDFYGATPGWFRINIGSPESLVRDLITRLKQIFNK
ncbi:aminotransferase, classes I and II, putative [Spiroplasma clarkii]|uniref:cysteine-S-conjugate beta-lyase n=1 Tax=Spiroplasma clarkii TaxID=2139 RepID=A0A1Y0L0H5_9MOLU|nr:aminotransferase class I/II-fold pyridoxal phosphate-dependent enzyme [Spiroplasma clarkii]ARU91496.1 aminotransferase, classes I and II, putative [Spiroplasma clarkii]ATX70911.1 cystathione beta-lyase [Spiroplasma clarkii]